MSYRNPFWLTCFVFKNVGTARQSADCCSAVGHKPPLRQTCSFSEPCLVEYAENKHSTLNKQGVLISIAQQELAMPYIDPNSLSKSHVQPMCIISLQCQLKIMCLLRAISVRKIEFSVVRTGLRREQNDFVPLLQHNQVCLGKVSFIIYILLLEQEQKIQISVNSFA